MTNRNEDLDSEFIRDLIEQERTISVFLVNGVRLEGRITREDINCFTMTREIKGGEHTQLIYKRSIASISPNS